MPVVLHMPDGSVVEVPTVVKKADDYREYYAHGAQGGILLNHHFRVDFYREDIPIIEFTEVGGKTDVEKLTSTGVERKVVSSVFLTLPFAKELVAWMERKIREHEKEYGQIQMPKGENIPPQGTGT